MKLHGFNVTKLPYMTPLNLLYIRNSTVDFEARYTSKGTLVPGYIGLSVIKVFLGPYILKYS